MDEFVASAQVANLLDTGTDEGGRSHFVAAPLRDAVLDGKFFSEKYSETATILSDFLFESDSEALNLWFGEHALRLSVDPDSRRLALDRDIAAIDAMIAAQVDEILHHQRMRLFEGSWRGLAWLIGSVDVSARIKVKVLNVGWPEICRDLERSAEFDQSNLFRKVYEEEFGMPGGEPYGILIVDHEVRHRPGPGAPTDDVAGISALAGVAAAAFAPVILGTSPALLQVDSFTELSMITDLTAPLRTPEYARWRSLSTREDMRFVGLTLPRVLARPPWQDDPARADGFRYGEYTPDASTRVWTSAVYAFAANAARAFAQYSWPADVRGADPDRIGGGVVADLPVEPFRTDPPHVWVRPSVDVVLSDRQERALVDAGLIPLSAVPFDDGGVFGAVRSMQMPGTGFIGGNAEAARANARLSSQLNSMLCVSRFAHYLKLLGREMVGSFQTADEIEMRLQSWLSGYVNSSETAGPDMRSRFPLVNGRVSVRERPGKPGVFGCTIQLQPHFQLDDVAASFRLVTDIAAPGMKSA